MTDLLRGRSIADAEKLMGGFLHLVKGEDAAGLPADDREQLEVMAGFPLFRCGSSARLWHGMP
jgi:nitrogen fixation NifU-like protein